MYTECPSCGYESFLTHFVPVISWARRFQRLLKLGRLWILSTVPMAYRIAYSENFTIFSCGIPVDSNAGDT